MHKRSTLTVERAWARDLLLTAQVIIASRYRGRAVRMAIAPLLDARRAEKKLALARIGSAVRRRAVAAAAVRRMTPVAPVTPECVGDLFVMPVRDLTPAALGRPTKVAVDKGALEEEEEASHSSPPGKPSSLTPV